MKAQEKETDLGGQAQVDAQVEALLARALAPQPPPQDLRHKVQREVTKAWDRRPPTMRERVGALLKMPVYQRTWAAVAALAAVAVVAALIAPSGGLPVAGTVIGKAGTVAAILATVAVIAIIVAWYLHKHRH